MSLLAWLLRSVHREPRWTRLRRCRKAYIQVHCEPQPVILLIYPEFVQNFLHPSLVTVDRHRFDRLWLFVTPSRCLMLPITSAVKAANDMLYVHPHCHHHHHLVNPVSNLSPECGKRASSIHQPIPGDTRSSRSVSHQWRHRLYRLSTAQ